jgi:EmrB/QacA subfamily drug resistance transporter
VSVFESLLVEPRRPERIRDDPRAPWLAVATVCIGAFMGQLDASIVTLALPTMQRQLTAGLGAVEWVALSYLLVLVSTITAIGRLADMAGRKLLYTYGFGVFTLGSLLCAVAPNLGFLIAARIVQAVGAAMLQANSVALIVHAIPPSRLGRAIGIQGAAQAVGLAIGPALGGLLVAAGGWRTIFLLNVPAGILGVALGIVMLPRSRELAPRQPFDWLGAALFTPAVAALLLAISFGRDLGWLSRPVAMLWSVAILLAVAFVAWERHQTWPLVDLRLLRRTSLSAGISSGLLSYLVIFGTLFVAPFYLEGTRHLTPARAGLVLAALPVALGVVSPVAGRLSERLGARRLTVAGMALAALALALMALLQPPDPGLAGGLALVGGGLGAFTPSNNAAIMGAAPRTASGVASGLLNMTRGLGTSLGVAVTGLTWQAAGLPGALWSLAAGALLAAALSSLRSDAAR